MRNNIELKINYLDGCMVEIVGEPNTQYDENETYEVLFINIKLIFYLLFYL